MQVTTAIDVAFNPTNQYPFNGVLANPSPALMDEVKRVANNIATKAKQDFGGGHQSVNPRRRRNIRQMRRTGAYFASNVKVAVNTNVQKVPTAAVISTANNSLAYEAAHGNMMRALLASRQGA